MVLLSFEDVQKLGLLCDKNTTNRLYNIDYTHLDKTKLALYRVSDLSAETLEQARKEHQMFLFDGEI